MSRNESLDKIMEELKPEAQYVNYPSLKYQQVVSEWGLQLYLYAGDEIGNVGLEERGEHGEGKNRVRRETVGRVGIRGRRTGKQVSKAGKHAGNEKAQGTANESRVLAVQSGRRVSVASVFRGQRLLRPRVLSEQSFFKCSV